jgi:hypothetical protein
MARKGKDEGFDPSGDGPNFRRDSSPSDLPPDQARDFAIRAANARNANKPKKPRKPSKKRLERGIAAQAHMNATQFREPPEMKQLPNANYVYIPPAPGTPGGPPLPRNTEEEPPKED